MNGGQHDSGEFEFTEPVPSVAQGRKRRQSKEPGLLGWTIAWLAGMATAAAVFWFWVPKVIVLTGEDGRVQSIRIDWDETAGRAVWRRLQRAKELDEQ